MNDAVSDIRSGRIDYAIVGGASAILRPQTSLAFAKLNMLSPEVRSPVFFQHLCRNATYIPLSGRRNL